MLETAAPWGGTPCGQTPCVDGTIMGPTNLEPPGAMKDPTPYVLFPQPSPVGKDKDRADDNFAFIFSCKATPR